MQYEKFLEPVSLKEKENQNNSFKPWISRLD
jgi:hypothetical protein